MLQYFITALLIAAGGLAPSLAAAEQQPELKPSAYDEFRALSAADRYADALPYAQQVVAPADDSGGQDFPAALNDLAATQFRLGDFVGAEASYMRLLQLLEQSEGIASPHFVAPLAGLAAIYVAQNRHDQAIDFYRQALAVSRRAHGLFNPAQVDLIEALAASDMVVGNYAEAETQHRYLVQIAERNFGEEDLRVVPALSELARWFEAMHNYVSARLTYARIYWIARKEGGNNNFTAIDALLNIGRMYRLQFVTDPESAVRQHSSVNQVTSTTASGVTWSKRRDFEVARADRAGHRALQKALDTLEDQDDPPADLLGRTLLELGDWYMAAHQPVRALKHYTRAAAIFADNPEEADANPLLAPRLVAYRPLPASVAHRWWPPAQLTTRTASFTLTVTEKGETRDVVLTSTDMLSMQAFQLQQAIERALYSPRFESGLPVETTGVEFTAQWFDLILPKAADQEARPLADDGRPQQ